MTCGNYFAAFSRKRGKVLSLYDEKEYVVKTEN